MTPKSFLETANTFTVFKNSFVVISSLSLNHAKSQIPNDKMFCEIVLISSGVVFTAEQFFPKLVFSSNESFNWRILPEFWLSKTTFKWFPFTYKLSLPLSNCFNWLIEILESPKFLFTIIAIASFATNDVFTEIFFCLNFPISYSLNNLEIAITFALSLKSASIQVFSSVETKLISAYV